MKPKTDYSFIRDLYLCKREDSTALFQAIVSLDSKKKQDNAFKFLEQCVVQKRLDWWEKHKGNFKKTNQPISDGFRLFYEEYLGLKLAVDGEIIEKKGNRWVSRWWNSCPTLNACVKLGLDTRVVCKRVFHLPVQILLTQIDPSLRFKRNYDALRPYTQYCEEIILLEDEKKY